ncbi:MAG: hypothetical protein Q9183_003177, partial [Haloplaca sp. 2 TL-2023]
MHHSILQLLALTSITLASPVQIDRRALKTVVVTTTITADTVTTSTTEPLGVLFPAPTPAEPTGSFRDVSDASAPSSAASASASSSSIIPIIPLVAPSSTPEPENPCQKVCKTVGYSYEECLSDCQIIDGQAQLNAPGKVFPEPEISTPSSSTASVSTTKSLPSTDGMPTPQSGDTGKVAAGFTPLPVTVTAQTIDEALA